MTSFPKRGQTTFDSNYLRLKSGESVVFIPRGAYHEFTVEWVNKKPIYDSPNGKTRYKINVLVNDGGTMVPKVLEFGTSIYDYFAAIAEEMDLSKTKIKLSKHGEGLDTEYTVIPLGPVDAKTLKTMDDIPLIPLGTKAKTTATETTSDDDDKIPW